MSIKVEDVGGSRQIRVCQQSTPLPLIVLAVLLFVYAGAILRIFPAYQNHPPSITILVGCIPMILLFAYISIITNKKWFGGCQLITLTQSTMQVDSRIFGITTSRRDFMNQAVQSLRYEEWFPARGRDLSRLRQHGIRFEYKGVTQTIALDAETSDCMDLIDHMNEVYHFSTAPSREPAVIESLFRT